MKGKLAFLPECEEAFSVNVVSVCIWAVRQCFMPENCVTQLSLHDITLILIIILLFYVTEMLH